MQSLYTHLKKAVVEFWLNTEVKSFEKSGDKIKAVTTDQGKIETEELVIANGSWLQEVSKLLNINILMQPGKGYSIVYNDLPKNLLYPSILVDDRTATSPINRWLRIGGTMELSGHSDNILPKRVLAIYHAFNKYYPSMKLPVPDTSKAWFGYRPVTPDGMPYIGRHTRYSNLTYAGGHSMLGVSAASGTGKLVQEIISNTKSSVDLVAFNPERKF